MIRHRPVPGTHQGGLLLPRRETGTEVLVHRGPHRQPRTQRLRPALLARIRGKTRQFRLAGTDRRGLPTIPSQRAPHQRTQPRPALSAYLAGDLAGQRHQQPHRYRIHYPPSSP
ncbi:hypothetical protein [Streptomyces sp. NRRL S-378]|uniref:hypothetical protein n=1 Tax=Streptomyces sp. NRRL S-378 TaxID=1463904 RepID=UPI0004C7418D|nr:hypothetical protein [Streptomyces sp. NRRL S-378]